MAKESKSLNTFTYHNKIVPPKNFQTKKKYNKSITLQVAYDKYILDVHHIIYNFYEINHIDNMDNYYVEFLLIHNVHTS